MTTPFTNPVSRAPDAAAAYSAAIIAKLGDRDPVEVQARTPADLRSAVAELTPAQLDQPEAPGKWSVAQVVRHLADSEAVCGWRLRLVLAHDRPAITGYDQDAFVARLSGAYPDVAAAIACLAAMRAAHVALLRSLQPADWDRVGVHVERGPESVRHMAKLYAGHDLVHLAQIARIRTAIGA